MIATGTGTFKCKTFFVTDELSHTIDHKPSRHDVRAFRIQERKSMCYFVSIDKFIGGNEFCQ